MCSLNTRITDFHDDDVDDNNNINEDDADR